MRAWGLGLATVLLSVTSALAIDEGSLALLNWTHEGSAQRNRALAQDMPQAIARQLLATLASGVRGCACQPRRLRWAWSLSRPSDRKHPAILVAFEDRPHSGAVLAYERFAMLVFRDERYVVSGVLTLRRPRPENTQAALSVNIKPRRDLDDDGQPDLALTFNERWPEEHACGEARVTSTAESMSFEPTACPDEAALRDSMAPPAGP